MGQACKPGDLEALEAAGVDVDILTQQVWPNHKLDYPSTIIADKTDVYRAVFTSVGGRLKHFQLKKYRLTTDPDSPHLDMVVAKSSLPLGLYWTDAPAVAQNPTRPSFTRSRPILAPLG